MSNECQQSENQPTTKGPFVNISAYKFVDLDQLTDRREELLGLCNSLSLKGTILISNEGINIFVAGGRAQIDQLVDFFNSRDKYTGLPIKESLSDDQPFSRMLVRIKKEIIAFGVDSVRPSERTSPKLSAQQLKQWLDEGKPLTLLDVRNDYEVELGTFKGALPIGLDHFRDFPKAVENLPEDTKEKPVVMFCTGGIRCEKAGPFMEQQGFDEVYQLDGGILRYFEDVGGEHYDGECSVFDKRVAVDPELNETDTTQCYACQRPLTREEQDSPKYVPGESCPNCYKTPEEKNAIRIAARNEILEGLFTPLPGSEPYDNHRPLNVPLKYDGLSMLDFLCQYHPHAEQNYWADEIKHGRITYKERAVTCEEIVWAGQSLVHLIAGTVEPDVKADIKVIYEDDTIVVVDKPAPLPMHPCGRFNRNSLIYLLNAAFEGEKIRMGHRLDANTTGVVVLCRKRIAAQSLQTQFQNGTIAKTYLARVQGTSEPEFTCDAAISGEPSTAGIRLLDETGLDARTEFRTLTNFDDGTSLVECYPKTGRTNQIRLHLWHLGLPIMGDPIYLKENKIGSRQTLSVNEPPMCLHALKIEIEHPISAARLCFETERPHWAE